jgi:hypothetical protein
MILTSLFLIFYNIPEPVMKNSANKKKEVSKRNDSLDPNNNKNLPANPLIKKRGKKLRDDGFEHRLSKETT